MTEDELDPWDEFDETAMDDVPVPHDAAVDAAREAIVERLLPPDGDRPMFMRQIQVALEKDFFHWVTARALNELSEEGILQSETVKLSGGVTMRFFAPRKHRYWRRQARRTIELVALYSADEFSHAVGRQGEMLFDAGLGTAGFIRTAKNVSQFGDAAWTATGHNLDRIYLRDGVAYGAEIKNTFDYIPHDEMRTKLNMCDALGLRPLFIVRMAPKSYVQEVRLRGGFTLIFKYQLWPFGQESFAKQVSTELGLPVGCPAELAEGTVLRLLNWHNKQPGTA